MFRIKEDPSSGRFVQCLAKNYKNDSIVPFDMDMVGVMAAYSDRLCCHNTDMSMSMDTIDHSCNF